MDRIVVNTGKCGYIEKELILPIQNIFHNKPIGGLWGCFESTPENRTWKAWAKRVEPSWINDMDAYITIKDDAKILRIESASTFYALPFQEGNSEIEKFFGDAFKFLDFEKLSKFYDAIEFILSKEEGLDEILYAYDCDCVLIMNKDIILDIEQDFDKEDCRGIEYGR